VRIGMSAAHELADVCFGLSQRAARVRDVAARLLQARLVREPQSLDLGLARL